MKNHQIKRLVWADALRGLLILFVIIGHSLQFGDYENRLSWNIIYSFHMAAFFVISGYVSYKNNYNLSSLKNKAIQLLLPFISWSILAILLKGLSYKYLLDVIMNPDKSYWFLYALFVIIVLFTIIQVCTPFRTIRTKTISIDSKDLILAAAIFLLIILMIVLEFRLFGYQFISYYFGFYVLGYWLRKYNAHFSIHFVCAIGICWFLLSLFWRMHSVPLPLQGISFLPSSLLSYSYRYVTALLGSIFFLGFAMNCFNSSHNRIINVLCYLGKISLGLYIIHLFIGDIVSSYYCDLLSSNTSASFVLLDFITRFVISLLLILIIQRIPIVRNLFLGKK